jgi:hypothetical protein
MILRVIALALVFSIGVAQTQEISQTIEQTPDQFEARIIAELTEYAATHTEDEFKAEIERRLKDQLTESLAEEEEEFSAAGVISFNDFTLVPARKSLFDCIPRKIEMCRMDYNAEVIKATGVSFGLLGACAGLTAGTGLIACGAASVVHQWFQAIGAKKTRKRCEMQAQMDCEDKKGQMK